MRLFAALIILTLTTPVAAQPQLDLAGTSHHAGPGVPFWAEPVLPSQTLRLQTSIAPATFNEESILLVPIRLLGSFDFSSSVVGEASFPILLVNFADETRLELGNPRIGLEIPLLVKGTMHRWTFSLDLFLPVAQVFEPENPDEALDAAKSLANYGLAVAAFPNLVPDFMPEQISPVPGTHYRLVVQKFSAHVGVDLPLMINFDFDSDTFFDDFNFGIRYGGGFSYDLRPVFPTLDLLGYTSLSGDEAETTFLAALGIRGAFQNFEPGVSVAFPITTPVEALSTSVIVNIDLAYSFE